MHYRNILTVASSALLLFSLSACGSTTTPQTPIAPSSPSISSPAAVATDAPIVPTPAPAPEVKPDTSTVGAGSAMTALLALPVQPMNHTDDYVRAKFGPSWPDVDNNGCDTRNDILARDLIDIKKSDDCVVQTGNFADPYTAKTIAFDRSAGGGGSIDIDHIIPLSLAWQTGAASWDDAQRIAFANDPMVLVASDSSENRKKGDKDASAYLPPNTAFHCEYVARQITVRTNYAMWVTEAEKGAMQNVLDTCPQQPLLTGNPKASNGQGVPVDGNVAVEPAPAVIEPAPMPAPVPAIEVPVAGTDGNDPQFSSCAKAKTAGFGPYTSSDPEYGWYKDGDKDGTVCE